MRPGLIEEPIADLVASVQPPDQGGHVGRTAGPGTNKRKGWCWCPAGRLKLFLRLKRRYKVASNDALTEWMKEQLDRAEPAASDVDEDDAVV